MTARLAVFASGGGTNLQALIDRFNGAPGAAARVELVVAGRPGIGALARADAAGVTMIIASGPAADDSDPARQLLAELEARSIDVVVLAGYLRRVPLPVVERYQGRMLNIHPSLLPAFGGPGMYGMRVHQAVIASGARVSGATVHLVGDDYDDGPIVAQWPVPVQPGDTPESLAARVLRVEHLLLPAAIEALCGGLPSEPIAEDHSFELVARPEPSPASLSRLIDGLHA
jgi:formyltetrahydrofolate-dependent phosphoribosylglycinamide formyltransferase